jgi:hypothetical protein
MIWNIGYLKSLTNAKILLRVFQEEDAHYFKVASVNGSWVRVALAKSLEELVDSDIPQSVLKFRLACLDPIDETVKRALHACTKLHFQQKYHYIFFHPEPKNKMHRLI